MIAAVMTQLLIVYHSRTGGARQMAAAALEAASSEGGFKYRVPSLGRRSDSADASTTAATTSTSAALIGATRHTPPMHRRHSRVWPSAQGW